MNQKELETLKIGDIVMVSTHGNNKGKRGIVVRSPIGSRVYLKPLNCESDFYNTKIRSKNKDGYYGFSYLTIQKESSESIVSKYFYIASMLGKEGVSWPASNFTIKELGIIDRFLKELNVHLGGVTIDSIEILDEN